MGVTWINGPALNLRDTMNTNNPSMVAEEFARAGFENGYCFDFSTDSLTIEVDRYLSNQIFLTQSYPSKVEINLTAYIGETLCRLYQGKWTGEFFSTPERYGANFYTCKITINNRDFWPAEFIGYYIANGGKNEGTFYQYLKSAKVIS